MSRVITIVVELIIVPLLHRCTTLVLHNSSLSLYPFTAMVIFISLNTTYDAEHRSLATGWWVESQLASGKLDLTHSLSFHQSADKPLPLLRLIRLDR